LQGEEGVFKIELARKLRKQMYIYYWPGTTPPLAPRPWPGLKAVTLSPEGNNRPEPRVFLIVAGHGLAGVF